MDGKRTQPYLYMHAFSPKLRSHPACHIALSRVPCAVQQVLVGNPFKIQPCVHGLPWWLSDKESVYNAGDEGSVPGLVRSPGEGNGNPLQYSWLENTMDRGAWWVTVTKRQTRLRD